MLFECLTFNGLVTVTVSMVAKGAEPVIFSIFVCNYSKNAQQLCKSQNHLCKHRCDRK